MVDLDVMTGGRFAAYRFSGSWDAQKIEAAKIKLATWMAEKGLKPAEEAMIASYDPPFTPSFLKRNEILVRLQR